MPSSCQYLKIEGNMVMQQPAVKHIYTLDELFKEVKTLRNTFKIIRLVSPSDCKVYLFQDDKLKADTLCYHFWNRKTCYKYCISKQVSDSQGQGTKLESINGHIFIVIARFIILDGKTFTLELITELTDISGLGRNEHVIVEIRRLQEENSRLIRDPLTGCYSRHYMDTYFPNYVKEAEQQQKELCIAVLDMDEFKLINDRYGHDTGDEVLKSCSQFWLKYFDYQHHEFITRYGGDEFIIISMADTYEAFCHRLVSLSNSMRKNIVLGNGQIIPFSFTIGCACLSEVAQTSPSSSREALFKLADERMYMGKRSGKNRIVTAS